jgi:hypothetical protein
MNLKYQTGFGNEFVPGAVNSFFVVVVALLFVLVQAHAQSTASKPIDNEEYRVYDAVIAHMFAGNKVVFDNQATVRQFVIRNQTNTNYAYSDKKENWEQVRSRLGIISDETIADFEAKHSSSMKLKPLFSLHLPYTLLSEVNYESIFGATANNNGTAEYWTKFYSKYPDSGGYIWLSNVGFNKARSQALVYHVHWCGELCGTGFYVLLNRPGNEWKVEKAEMIWIS